LLYRADGGTAAIPRRHGFVTIRAFRRRLRIDARTFVAEVVAAIRAEDADRYAGLYAEDAVIIEPLLGEPLRGREAIRAGEAALFAAFGDVEPEVISIVSEVGGSPSRW
jgi:ketosteroid isomerase-like protein